MRVSLLPGGFSSRRYEAGQVLYCYLSRDASVRGNHDAGFCNSSAEAWVGLF